MLKGKDKNVSCESFHFPRRGPVPPPGLQQHPNMPLVLIKSQEDVNGHISSTYRVIIAGAVAQAGKADIYSGGLSSIWV